MNREKAKQMFKDDKDAYGKPRAIMAKIDKIFDEFEGEKGDLQSDINNKLSSLKNLISLVDTFLNEENPTVKGKLVEFIGDEMEVSKASIEYLTSVFNKE